MIEREDPPLVGDERAMLEGWLDFHRATLLHKCEGLTGAQLAQRSVPPSGMSLQGLVRHLTLVERAWFRRPFGADEDPEPLPWGQDFQRTDPACAEDDLVAYRIEVERCRQVTGPLDLDSIGLGRRGGREVSVSLRWVYLHMIEEYARHNGHADLLRERVDGVTGV